MNINDVDWIDSQLKKITIEYDKAELFIECDSVCYVITCTGLVGLTNLCIWDDTIIENICVTSIDPLSDAYLQQVYSNYDKDFNYGGRSLKEAKLVLSVALINNMTFNIYCQKIDVSSSSAIC